MAFLKEINFDTNHCHVNTNNNKCSIHFPEIKVPEGNCELCIVVSKGDSNIITIDVQKLVTFKVNVKSDKATIIYNNAENIEFSPWYFDKGEKVLEILFAEKTVFISYTKNNSEFVIKLNGNTNSAEEDRDKYYVEAIFDISDTEKE